jgi:DNA-binding transcriptional ArsR family regulator/rhodanese-related sulfurtransferase
MPDDLAHHRAMRELARSTRSSAPASRRRGFERALKRCTRHPPQVGKMDIFSVSMEFNGNQDSARAALAEALALPAKGLGHPKRLEIMEILAQGERSVEDLSQAAGLGLTTTSAHLQTLRRCGLVARRREGTRIHYRLANDDVAVLIVMVQRVARAHLAEVDLVRNAALGLGPSDADVEPLGRDALLDRARAGDVLVLDVRPEVEFAAGHIPGAISIPLDALPGRLGELPDGLAIVAYCRGEFCAMAHDAAGLLRAEGHRATVLGEGMLEWRAAGQPVATSP